MKKTELGYPVLSDDLHAKLFGKEPSPKMEKNQLARTKKLLKEFNIPTPVDYPKGLYDGELPLPDLRGNFLREHYEKIAEEQIGEYKKYADAFAEIGRAHV